MSQQSQPTAASGSTWSATLSKKRYQELEELLACHVQDASVVATILQGFCNIMHFDPNAQQYTPEVGKRQRELRKKRAQALGFASHRQFLQTKSNSHAATESVAADSATN